MYICMYGPGLASFERIDTRSSPVQVDRHSALVKPRRLNHNPEGRCREMEFYESEKKTLASNLSSEEGGFHA